MLPNSKNEAIIISLNGLRPKLILHSFLEETNRNNFIINYANHERKNSAKAQTTEKTQTNNHQSPIYI